ncbi:MAG: glycogen-binding domain-containing protein [Endomicrobia bacterium]|nr:glycogen-binding domain-containing protein [Endomicrobiia bacterium]
MDGKYLKKTQIELLLKILSSFKNHLYVDIMFTEEEIDNILNSLPKLDEVDIDVNSEMVYYSKNFFSNFVKYVFFPTLVGVVLLIFTIRYLQNIMSDYYIETTFFIYNPQAKSVKIAGDFTNWEPISLNRKNGLWKLKINLKPGQYKYIYIIDDVPYLDPQKEIYEDQFGNKNSIIYV